MLEKIASEERQVIEKVSSEEGYKQFLYDCTSGEQTIGYGCRIEMGIPEPVARFWLEYNIRHLLAKLSGYDFYRDLDLARQTVLVDMAYQMGIAGLLGFKNMIKAIKRKDWDAAYEAILDSKYAKIDSPNRSRRNAETMRTGVLLFNN